MLNQTTKTNPQDFQVKIGHTTVTVSGQSPSDAIRAARQKLSLEMPRMWDVINKLDDTRFEVTPVK